MFLWLAARSSLMTDWLRMDRWISVSGDCTCCPGVSKDVLHVLRDCHKVVEV